MNFYEQLVHQAGSNFYRYSHIYQSGGAPVEISNRDKSLTYEEKIEKVSSLIKDSEVIVVGAASGMSTAAGQDFYYEPTESFRKYFGAFEKKYGFHGTFDGVYYRYRTREEFWGFMITLLHHTIHAPAGQAYYDLDAIINNKEFYVITTNQDTQFNRLYSEDKISAIQGDERYFQCSKPCCDEVFDARETIDRLYEEIDDDLRLPADRIPRCPHCGAEMRWWVRGFTFLEGQKYHNEYQKAADFISDHKDKRILFMELGVGRMTPMFIQEPFWNMTLNLPYASYLTINPRDAILPKQLEDRGLAIHEDIADILRDVRIFNESGQHAISKEREKKHA